MTYPIPADESKRLEELRSYAVLDTPPEQEYDDLVALAAEICQTPIALISLIDETRQWFKARIGLEPAQTSRELSFCAHAIVRPDKDLFVVPDACTDARFSANDLVTGAPHIRFYAGAPLVTSNGFAVGTLCVIDRKPRELTPSQIQAMRVLRRQIVNAFELRRLAQQQRTYITQLHEAQHALEAARVKAESATKAKSQFLATMTHEIRTPMNAVLGMTTLLQDTPLNPAQAECVETIRSSGEILLTLINDILDFSKIESGRLELEHLPFRVAELVRSSTNLLASAAAAKGVSLVTRLDAGLPQSVAGDMTRLRQILVNLLANAVKFTAHGEIVVQAGAAPRSDGGLDLTIAVTDSGIGIPPDRMSRLFQAYSQVETSTTREYGGTGLGLAISRRLAELHGGRIWVESTPGRGSTFSFTVAVARVAATSTPASVATPVLDPNHAAQHPARVLLVEDNTVNQKVAVYLLRRLGYQPQVASNGQEALDLLAQQTFDVVLMDGEMPVMNGHVATQRIRQDLPADRQPAIVAFTAQSLSENHEAWSAAGADGYLEKPLRAEQLMRILAQVPALKQTPRR